VGVLGSRWVGVGGVEVGGWGGGWAKGCRCKFVLTWACARAHFVYEIEAASKEHPEVMAACLVFLTQHKVKRKGAQSEGEGSTTAGCEPDCVTLQARACLRE